jgi:outer membrane immunogenic protein
MRRLATLLAAAIGVAAAHAASAADLPARGPVYKAPVAIAAYNWSGCYIGGNVGGAWGRSNVDIPLYPDNFNIDTSSVTGGGHVGCNYMFPNRWVIGIEGDWSAMDLDGDAATTNGPVLGERFFVKWDWMATVRGRLGYSWDRTLVYVTGGGAWANLDSANYIPACVPGCGVNASATYSGWTVGFGFEYAMTQRWIIGVEYLHAEFDGKTFFFNGPTTVDHDVDLVRARLSFKW